MWIRLLEVALPAGNGIPVVTAEQHGDDLIADGNQQIPFGQPADGDDNGNQQKQSRIQSNQASRNIPPKIQRASGGQRTEKADGNKEAGYREEYVNAVESAWHLLLHAVI